MKKVRRFLLIAVILAFLIRIYIRSEYRFPNDMESIVSVQIMQCSDTEPWDPSGYWLLKELNTNESPEFMEKIYSLETERGGTPPRWSYGEYMAKITYANGDMECLGTHCIAFVPSGEWQSGVGEYYFADEEAFLNLIQQYLL